jgi:hypothetical protein
MRKVATLILLAGWVILAGAPRARAGGPRDRFPIFPGDSPDLAQVVALDECDPVTFNAFEIGRAHV